MDPSTWSSLAAINPESKETPPSTPSPSTKSANVNTPPGKCSVAPHPTNPPSAAPASQSPRVTATLSEPTYEPTNAPSEGSPLIHYVRGGAYVMSSAAVEERFMYEFPSQLNAVVIAPTYRLAPEQAFPTGPEDIWDAFKHVASNHTSISPHIDIGKGFIVAGTSAGANAGAVLALRARDAEIAPKLTVQVLLARHTLPHPPSAYIYPSEHTSRKQNASAPAFDTSFLDWLFAHYAPPPRCGRFAPLL
ncbi:alpha/beta-hydrolase [Patellaria atrata CBS 101060]|uniref:Alpha/beta-hydrolase n=1 Tax=Patellaria atrata CBS 101060 TaxID=1346257 RepID=A0A9P4SE73_9PEZI|nr:alpha/beta-hydrolase [Patellaria atrata CBS 101060]